MTLNRVAETILTSCLLLSRAWTRPSNVVCDGGRGEGDKWFDGCRWCVCQQSGPLCSSSECSPLVSKVAPCQKVDSRWWDGCYHCKCYHHGIDCTVDDTCLMLMRSERYGLDFLSHDACHNAQDGRCVCGIDGVPSCTAEVIDRNAHPATTVRLNPVFPAASSIISPRHVYYNQPYKHSRGIRNDRPSFYGDSLYINHPDGPVEKLNNVQLKKHVHSLVKRHTGRNKKHSPQVYTTKHRRSQNNKNKSAVGTHKSSSHNSRNSRKHFEESSSGRRSRGRRKNQDADTVREDSDNVFNTDLIIANDGSQFYPNLKWRVTYSPNNVSGSNIKKYKNTYKEHYETVPGGEREELEELLRLASRNADAKFKKRTEPVREVSLEGKYLNDEAAVENLVNDSSASLLIASGNRCRWGVRWYGGSLRCYCGMENSITCGDPSFVASRIDGFRLERASCEVGQAWDDSNACRACECQIKGVVLCTRSPSCPLPFLIKPLPVHPDEGEHFDRKDDDVDGKGQSSIGHTDEFTGQEVHKVVFDKDISKGDKDSGDRKEGDLESDVYINKEGDNLTVVDFTDGKIKSGSKLEVTNLITISKNDSEETGKNNGNKDVSSKNNNVEIGRGGDSTDGENKKDNVLRLGNGITKHPDIIIPQENISTAGDVNINLGEDDVGKGGKELSEEIANNRLDNVGNTDFKRTTQVIVGECKPLSRWLDGCKRCRCDKDGKKNCNDSRCLKPISVIPGLINNIPSDNGDKTHTRPVQRPPPELFLSRDGPINLQPPFLGMNLCGRFTVGEKYWDECNICLCTPHGPKCTAKNCA